MALSLDGQPVGTATAAADGTYQAHVVVPLVSVGIHDVVAVCRGVTVRTPITIVRFTAAAGSAVTALAATLGFFVVLGLAFVLIRPQSGTTLSAIPEGSQASPS